MALIADNKEAFGTNRRYFYVSGYQANRVDNTLQVHVQVFADASQRDAYKAAEAKVFAAAKANDETKLQEAIKARDVACYGAAMTHDLKVADASSITLEGVYDALATILPNAVQA